MKKPVFLVILTIILIESVLFGLSDTSISIADTATPNNAVISTTSKAGNSSTSATITITMTGVPNE